MVAKTLFILFLLYMCGQHNVADCTHFNVIPGGPKKLHNETCSRRYLSKQKINSIEYTKLYSLFSMSSLQLDNTFEPVTPLIDGVVSEARRQFATLRDDCTLELLDCSESSPP